jgi:hypothetical protein
MRIRYRLRNVPSKTCLKPLYLSVLEDDRHTGARANGESRLNVRTSYVYILVLSQRTTVLALAVRWKDILLILNKAAHRSR